MAQSANTKKSAKHEVNIELPRTSASQATRSVKGKQSETSNSSLTDYVERYIVIPPDGGFSWVVVFGAFVSYFVADGSMFSFGLFLDDISITLNCTKSEVALAGAIKTGVLSLSGPISAALINRFGYRLIAICGSLLAMTSSILTSRSPSLPWFLLFYGLLGGLGFGMIFVTAVTVIGFYFGRYRALATGIAVCGSGFGGMAIPPIITMLMANIGWRNTFLVMASCTASCLVCAFLFIDLKPVRVRFQDSSSVLAVEEFEAAAPSSFFNHYHNTTYPSLLMKPSGSVHVTKATSSEILLTNYQSTSVNERSVAGKSEATTAGTSTVLPQAGIRDVSRYSSEKKNCCYVKMITAEDDEYYVCCCLKKCAQISDDEGYAGTSNCCRKSDSYDVRPLYRDDIFYTGSLGILPEFKNKMSFVSNKSRVVDMGKKGFVEYHMSVTRVHTYREIAETKNCRFCPDSMSRIIATMLDFRLLKEPAFLLLTFNAVCTSIGFYTPFMFIKDRGVENGVNPDITFWYLSLIGLTNTIGRILCGLVSLTPKIKAELLCSAFLIIGGISTALSGLSYSMWYQFTYCGIYGISVSCMAALRSSLIVEAIGLENLTNAVGLILMFQGVSSLIGTTISAYLIQLTGIYDYSFYFAGILMAIGGTILLPIRSTAKRKKHKPFTVQQASDSTK